MTCERHELKDWRSQGKVNKVREIVRELFFKKTVGTLQNDYAFINRHLVSGLI